MIFFFFFLLSLEGLPEANCVQLQCRLSLAFSTQYVHCSGWRKNKWWFFFDWNKSFWQADLCTRKRQVVNAEHLFRTNNRLSLARLLKLARRRLCVVCSPWRLSPYRWGRREVIFWQKPTCHLWAAQDSSFIHKHNPTCNQILPPCFCYSVCS